ncbi:hypothetical protein TNCV_5113831 [Trichonephila clavipes]|nr:hypothetical protein TNCV_5113831 [Trichonephila clavipes]
MEDDKVFALNLSLYPGADLGDFMNFMVLLRSHVNTLKPSEIIALGSTVDLVEKIRQLFPHLDRRDSPLLEPYTCLEPADLSHDYLEKEASKGKGAFIQAVWTVIGKPKLYNLVTKTWTEQGPQTLTPWIQLVQMVLDGCYGQKWPDTVFQVPDAWPICLTPIHKQERTQCGQVFHKKCLLQHLDIRNTCLMCRALLIDPQTPC